MGDEDRNQEVIKTEIKWERDWIDQGWRERDKDGMRRAEGERRRNAGYT